VSHFLEKYDNKVYYVAEKLGISKNKIYNMINQGLIKLEE
jgi:plasmid maintenance system antidote protein VapI